MTRKTKLLSTKVRNRTTLSYMWKVGLCICFVLLWWLPILQQHFSILDVSNIKLHENRRQTKLPPLSANNIWDWPANFASYYHDSFGFRNLLIKTANSISFHIFGRSPVSRVLIGKDDWLFYGQRPQRRFARGLSRFSQAELERIASVYTKRQEIVHDMGGHFLLLAIPSKVTIYPEYYSSRLPIINTRNRFDQALDYLQQHTTVKVLYLKDALLAAKQSHFEPLYIPTDSHWNDLGAYVGYESVFKYLKSLFPNLEQIPKSDFKLIHKKRRGGFANMLGVFNPPHSLVPVFEALKPDLPVSQARARRKQVQANILGKQLPLHIRRSAQTFEGHNNSLYIPKVLVYRNSFFTRLGKFILRHFKEADLYSNTYFSFDPTIVKKRRPQLVIEQVTDNGFTVPTDHQN